MGAPSKAQIIQSVRIRSRKRVANTLEVNSACMEVTKYMKPEESMYQAVTQVNVSGPVIIIVAEADATHLCGKQYCFSCQWQEGNSSVGVLIDGMVQDGLFVNLGDLHSLIFLSLPRDSDGLITKRLCRYRCVMDFLYRIN